MIKDYGSSHLSLELLTAVKIIKKVRPITTQLEVNKILYFLYCDYVKDYKKELFKENFECWFYGPTIREIYYNKYKNENISINWFKYIKEYDEIIITNTEKNNYLISRVKHHTKENVITMINKTHHDTCWSGIEYWKVMDKKTIFKHHSEIGSDWYKGEEND